MGKLQETEVGVPAVLLDTLNTAAPAYTPSRTLPNILMKP